MNNYFNKIYKDVISLNTAYEILINITTIVIIGLVYYASILIYPPISDYIILAILVLFGITSYTCLHIIYSFLSERKTQNFGKIVHIRDGIKMYYRVPQKVFTKPQLNKHFARIKMDYRVPQKGGELTKTIEPPLFEVPQLAIVGVGGAGINSINCLELGGLDNISRIAINTDWLALSSSKCEKKILIGQSLIQGQGTGGSPGLGRKAAELDKELLRGPLRGKNFVFITAGMGGGTGTGAAPVVAEIAKEEGALVIAIVIYPFEAEVIRRKKVAEGIKRLRETADIVLVLENDMLRKYAGNLPINDAFRIMDRLIADILQGIVQTVTKPSLVNIDFADLKALIQDGGFAGVLIGKAWESDNEVEAVVEDALSHPLLKADYRGAKGALINVTGHSNLTMKEISDIIELLTYKLNPDANVIWDARVDDKFDRTVRVVAIMTGIKPKLFEEVDQK